MSQENVEIVRRAWEYEIFGRGGGDGPFGSLRSGRRHEPRRGTNRLTAERRSRASSDSRAPGKSLRSPPVHRCRRARPRQTAHFGGRGRASGIPVDAGLYEVYTLSDGKVVRIDEFTDRNTAFQAAGLSTTEGREANA